MCVLYASTHLGVEQTKQIKEFVNRQTAKKQTNKINDDLVHNVLFWDITILWIYLSWTNIVIPKWSQVKEKPHYISVYNVGY